MLSTFNDTRKHTRFIMSGVNFNVKLIKDFQCRLDALEG